MSTPTLTPDTRTPISPTTGSATAETWTTGPAQMTGTVPAAAPAQADTALLPASGSRTLQTAQAAPVPVPQAYHRLARAIPRERYWWRPLVAVAVFGASYVVMFLVMALPGIVLSEAVPELAFSESMADARNPMDMVMGLGSIAIMIPAVLIAVRVAYGRLGIVHSVRGRFRWGMLGRAAVVVLPFYVLLNIGLTLLIARSTLEIPPLTWPVVAATVIILLIVPLQAAGEEYAFRALPLQVFGTWLRSPLWGILLPVPLFMVGHGYHWVGQIDIALFAIAMGALAWKTGGLELPILLHVANNWTIFMLAPFMKEELVQGAVPPVALLFSTVPMLLITAGLWWWHSRREGLGLWEPARGTLTQPSA